MASDNLKTHNAIIPHLTVHDAVAAIEFYKKALGFEELHRMAMGNGKIMHCHLQREGQALLLNDEFPGIQNAQMASPRKLRGSSVTLHINVPDVDAAFNRAIAAGGKVVMPVMDMFWGDRYGAFDDPFGHHWSVSTHVEDVSPDEILRRGQAMFARAKR